MKLICKQCGNEFELSESEIDFYKNKNLHIPKRCEKCRRENKKNKAAAEKHYENADMQNKYLTPSNSSNVWNSGRNSKWLCAVSIIAILLSVGATVLSHVDLFDEYSVIIEPVYGEDTYTSGEIYKQSESYAAKDKPAEEFDVSAEILQEDSGTDAKSIQSDVISVVHYKFRNSELLNEHYEKHGREMGFATAEEYQDAASDVVTNSNALHKLEAEDGDDVYYIESSNDFVIVSTDGYIRTYFKPDSGIEYYNRQ